MRYARRSCEECIKLAAERAALFQDYLDAKDALALTRKQDRTYADRRKRLEAVAGKLREAGKREDAHEATHQDEFSDWPSK